MATKITQQTPHYYIYRFLNCKNEVIYVGKTQMDLKKRILGHLKLQTLTQEQIEEINTIQYIEVDNVFNWHILEIFYINYFKAKYNKEFKTEEETFSILNLKRILNQYFWQDFMNHQDFKDMLNNIDNPYNQKGFLKTQKELQLTQNQLNQICNYFQNSQRNSDKINWLLLNLLAYSTIPLKELVFLTWNDIDIAINKQQIPYELINYYNTIVNPTLKYSTTDYVIQSQKKGFILPPNVTGKIKKIINKFFKGNYNSRSFKNICCNYYSNNINPNDIIWLQSKKKN